MDSVSRRSGRAHPLAWQMGDFLTDPGNIRASRHTRWAYRGDLVQFAAHQDGEIGTLYAATVRAYLAEVADLAPSTCKRKRAAVASFCRWAVRYDLLRANPMDKIDTVKVRRRLPRPSAAADVAAVLAVICSRRPRKDVPPDRLRDRVLFETAYVCGARASEVCGLHVEDRSAGTVRSLSFEIRTSGTPAIDGVTAGQKASASARERPSTL